MKILWRTVKDTVAEHGKEVALHCSISGYHIESWTMLVDDCYTARSCIEAIGHLP